MEVYLFKGSLCYRLAPAFLFVKKLVQKLRTPNQASISYGIRKQCHIYLYHMSCCFKEVCCCFDDDDRVQFKL